MVVSNLILVLNKKHVSNGGKMYRSIKEPCETPEALSLPQQACSRLRAAESDFDNPLAARSRFGRRCLRHSSSAMRKMVAPGLSNPCLVDDPPLVGTQHYPFRQLGNLETFRHRWGHRLGIASAHLLLTCYDGCLASSTAIRHLAHLATAVKC